MDQLVKGLVVVDLARVMVNFNLNQAIHQFEFQDL